MCTVNNTKAINYNTITAVQTVCYSPCSEAATLRAGSELSLLLTFTDYKQ